MDSKKRESPFFLVLLCGQLISGKRYCARRVSVKDMPITVGGITMVSGVEKKRGLRSLQEE